MKKLLVGILAAFMVFAVAGSASAAFERGNAILVGWAGATDNEVALDLGNINGLLNQTNYELYAAGTTFGLGDFTTISNLSQVKFNAYSSTADYHWTFALNAPLSPVVMQMNAYVTFNAGEDVTSTFFDTNDVNGVAKVKSSNLSSFFNKMGYLGNYASLNTAQQSFGNSSIDLADGYVDLYLYEFYLGATGVVPFVGPDASTQYKAVLRVGADGSVLLNPTAASSVPVPSAAILLAFGLIGLAGLQRKRTI